MAHSCFIGNCPWIKLKTNVNNIGINMKQSTDDYQNKMNFYIEITPRLNWFSPSERAELIREAEQNAKIYNSDFLSILANLTFMRSIGIDMNFVPLF